MRFAQANSLPESALMYEDRDYLPSAPPWYRALPGKGSMNDVPAPFGAPFARLIFWLVMLVPVISAVFVFHWPWWGVVLAPVLPLAFISFIANRYEAATWRTYRERHPERLEARAQEAWLQRHPDAMIVRQPGGGLGAVKREAVEVSHEKDSPGAA